MNSNLSNLQQELDETVDWLEGELAKLRTGRASAAILDGITVESYGSQMPIDQLAQVGNEDPRTLRISPYDASQIEAIQKAIQKADLGVSVATDEEGLRLSFPPLTEESREDIMRRAKTKLEEARVSVRSIRDDVWSEIKEQEVEGEISEDEKFRLKEAMEGKVKETNQRLEKLFEEKEEKISA